MTKPGKIVFVAFKQEEPGLVFSHASRRVFLSMVQTANISLEDCFVTCLFKTPEASPKWLRDPERFEPASLALKSELQDVGPTVIVPLTGEALWAFSGQSMLAKLRGAVFEADRLLPGAKLLPTFHPAYVQTQWHTLALVVSDLIKAAREYELGPKMVYSKRTLLLQPTVGDVETYCRTCRASDLLSVDIETGWGCITCVGLAPSADEAMCIPFVDMRKPNKSYWQNANDEARVWRALKALLESDTPKVGQNFTYDAFWLADYGIGVRNYLHDTRLMHHALYPELPKSLGSMAANYTNLPTWKSWGGREDKRDG